MNHYVMFSVLGGCLQILYESFFYMQLIVPAWQWCEPLRFCYEKK